MENVCQVTIVHKEKVTVIKNKLDQKDFSNLLVLGKCFSDSSRIKIFYALETYKEMCVCDLAEILTASVCVLQDLSTQYCKEKVHTFAPEIFL